MLDVRHCKRGYLYTHMHAALIKEQFIRKKTDVSCVDVIDIVSIR